MDESTASYLIVSVLYIINVVCGFGLNKVYYYHYCYSTHSNKVRGESLVTASTRRMRLRVVQSLEKTHSCTITSEQFVHIMGAPSIQVLSMLSVTDSDHFDDCLLRVTDGGHFGHFLFGVTESRHFGFCLFRVTDSGHFGYSLLRVTDSGHFDHYLLRVTDSGHFDHCLLRVTDSGHFGHCLLRVTDSGHFGHCLLRVTDSGHFDHCLLRVTDSGRFDHCLLGVTDSGHLCHCFSLCYASLSPFINSSCLWDYCYSLISFTRS